MRWRCLSTLLFFAAAVSIAQVTETDGDWSEKYAELYNTPEAELMVRTGDIDNLGFGWPNDFDPFSGNNTPRHSFPWTPDTLDPNGTDRIMVPTSYTGNPPAGQDGYVGSTSRPENSVRPIMLTYSLGDIAVTSAIIQMFVDDFQAPVWQAQYQVKFDNIRIPLMEDIINSLVQTGPIGKIITARIPDQFLYLLGNDTLEILIDDYTTGAGDGYAIDFVKLLVNPDSVAQIANINGTIKDAATEQPLQGVRVVANGNAEAFSDSMGFYNIDSVLAGLVSVQTFKEGYGSQTKSVSVAAGASKTVNFDLQNPAPQVVMVSPQDDSFSVARDSDIRVYFNTAMDTFTINDFTFFVSDGDSTVAGTITRSDSGAVFTPDTLLDESAQYTVSLTTGILDQNGIALQSDYSWGFNTGDPVSIRSEKMRLPQRALLHPNYPNPFNPSTRIRLDIRQAGSLSVAVFDITGRKVRQLFDGFAVKGSHTFHFSGVDIAAGVYYLQAQMDGFLQTRKMVLIK